MCGLPFPALLLMYLESIRKKNGAKSPGSSSTIPPGLRGPRGWLGSGSWAEKKEAGVLGGAAGKMQGCICWEVPELSLEPSFYFGEGLSHFSHLSGLSFLLPLNQKGSQKRKESDALIHTEK